VAVATGTGDVRHGCEWGGRGSLRGLGRNYVLNVSLLRLVMLNPASAALTSQASRRSWRLLGTWSHVKVLPVPDRSHEHTLHT
jgi:hypothetical protein